MNGVIKTNHDVIDGGCEYQIGNRSAEAYQPPIFGRQFSDPISADTRDRFGIREDGDDDGAGGKGGAELERVDWLHASRAVGIGEAVAGVVADGVQLSQLM